LFGTTQNAIGQDYAPHSAQSGGQSVGRLGRRFHSGRSIGRGRLGGKPPTADEQALIFTSTPAFRI